MTEKLTLNVAEAAKLMGVDKMTVYNLCHADRIPHLRIGKRFLICRKALGEWIYNQSIGKISA
ncbi:MAG: helix-turn-helix domain-containing protein [Oscillospiraceae bacterium]|nr:helix-turn-helix domain-containing protein [Oscillospiraceae bacterium]